MLLRNNRLITHHPCCSVLLNKVNTKVFQSEKCALIIGITRTNLGCHIVFFYGPMLSEFRYGRHILDCGMPPFQLRACIHACATSLFSRQIKTRNSSCPFWRIQSRVYPRSVQLPHISVAGIPISIAMPATLPIAPPPPCVEILSGSPIIRLEEGVSASVIATVASAAAALT